MAVLKFEFSIPLLFFVFLFLVKPTNAIDCSVNFTSGCEITQNLTLSPGIYVIESIIFVADNVIFDCNGATLQSPVYSGGIGIFVANRGGIAIRNCNMTGYGHALSTYDAGPINNVLVENNNFFDNYIIAYLHPPSMFPLNNSRSRNNIFRNNTAMNIGLYGFLFRKFDNLTFADNTVYALYGSASSRAVNLDNVRDSIFINNIINVTNGYNGGFYLTVQSQDNYIVYNTLMSNRYGVRVAGESSRNTIANNTFMFNSEAGIDVQGNTQTNITRNIIKFNSLGIKIWASLGNGPVYVINNDLSDNMHPLDQAFDQTNTSVWSDVELFGNHWSNYDNEVEGCVDILEPLNVCDDPKGISDGILPFSNGSVIKDYYPVKTPFLFAGVPAPSIKNVAVTNNNESEILEIKVNATNFLGLEENLIFTINDSRFIQNGSTFMWQTNFNDAGNYTWYVDVIDGVTSLHNFTFVNVIINNITNTECGAIPKNSCTISQNTVFSNPTGNMQYILKDGINMVNDGITLDCNNVTLDALFYPYPVNNGIKMQGANNNIIKNCNSKSYNHNLYISNSSNNTFENNNLRNAKINGIRLTNSNLNQFNSNTIDANGIGNANGAGIYSQGSSNNQFIYNIIKSNTNAFGGLYLKQSSNNNLIKKNNFDTNLNGVAVDQSTNNIVTENNVLNSYGQGIRFLLGTSNNVAYRNNMIDNGLIFGAAQMQGTASNQFSFNNQGNYYNNYDEPSEGCLDNNNNGFCDNPYTFPITNDPFPFTYQNGWNPIMILQGNASFGSTMNFIMQAINYSNQPYIMAFSDSDNPPIVLPNGLIIPLAGGPVLITTIFYGPAVGLTGNVGTFDSNGRAYVQFSVPIPGLQGLTLFTAFVIADNSGDIVAVSPSYNFTIM